MGRSRTPWPRATLTRKVCGRRKPITSWARGRGTRRRWMPFSWKGTWHDDLTLDHGADRRACFDRCIEGPPEGGPQRRGRVVDDLPEKRARMGGGVYAARAVDADAGNGPG